jgi:hypothetical protein
MATLRDEQLRALRFLARHPGGCTGATLLEQLSQLVYAGLAKLRAVGRPKLFRVKITEAGQRAIAAGVDWSSRARHPVVGVRTTAGRGVRSWDRELWRDEMNTRRFPPRGASPSTPRCRKTEQWRP